MSANYIVSANYRDRSSKYKYLVRESGQRPEAAIAVLAIVCIGVRFCPSSDFESGFGCNTIAECQDVEYKASDVEPQVDEFEVKFAGRDFTNRDTGDVVDTLDELVLSPSGKMTGKQRKKYRDKKRAA